MKKQTPIRQHQRQFISRKKIILLCAYSLTAIAVCTTLFFNVLHVGRIQATNNPEVVKIQIIEEQTWITDKEIAAPIIKQQNVLNEQTISVKKTNALTLSPITGQ